MESKVKQKRKKTRYICSNCGVAVFSLVKLHQHLSEHYVEFLEALEYPMLSESEVKLLKQDE